MQPEYDVQPAEAKISFEIIFYQNYDKVIIPTQYRCNVCFFIKKFYSEKYGNFVVKNCGNFKLRRCKGCFSIGYCSTAHQKLHWKYHKSFCIKTRVETRKMMLNQFFEKLVGFNIQSPESEMKDAINHVRSLSKHDMYIMMFSFRCFNCQKGLYELNMENPNKIKTCKNCEVAGYCSRECKMNDSKEHKRKCKYMKMLVNFYYKSQPIELKIENVPNEINLLKVKNLSQLLSYFGVKDTIDDDFYPANQADYSKMISVGAHSLIATLLYSLQYCGLNNKSNLAIQIAGNCSIYRSENDIKILTALLPNLQKLSLVNVLLNQDSEGFHMKQNYVSVKDRKIILKEYLIAGQNENIYKKDNTNMVNLENPDIVFLDNIELRCFPFPKEIFKFDGCKNSIFVWTSNRMDESNEVLKAIKKYLKAEIILENFINPFKDLKPEFVDDELVPWFLNWYINIFKLSNNN